MKVFAALAVVVALALVPAPLAAQGCSYVVSTSLLTVGDEPASGTITVTTGPSCSWTASSTSTPVIQVDNGSGGAVGTVTGSGTFRWLSQQNGTRGVRTATINVLPTGLAAIPIAVLQRGPRAVSIYNAIQSGFMSRDLTTNALAVQNLKTDNGCAICRSDPATPWGISGGGTGPGTDPHPTYSLLPSAPFTPSGTAPGYFRRDAASGTNLIDVPYMAIRTPTVMTLSLPPIANPDYAMAALGDFDGDRHADLVWRNPVTGAVAIWLLDDAQGAETVRAIVDLPGLPSNFVLGGAYDFNSDGIDDLVWRNTSNGNVAVWLMSSGTPGFSSVVNLPALPDSSYYIGAIDDFDDDGQPDILWRNDATGALATWKMNNTTFVGIVDLAPLAGVAVVGPH